MGLLREGSMAADQVSLSLEEMLVRATMSVSRSHLLLTGVVDNAKLPDVRAMGRESLATLEDAIRDLRAVGVSLHLRSME